MPFYPDQVNALAGSPENAGPLERPSASGRALNLDCGCIVAIEIAEEGGTILDIKFTSNGCGYMLAAADSLATNLKGLSLSAVSVNAPTLSPERAECVNTVTSAAQAAFADLRAKRVREFIGESALVCSCFGVDEATIEEKIRSNGLRTVEQVTSETRAGGGCGSCRMVIQEMIDAEAVGADML